MTDQQPPEMAPNDLRALAEARAAERKAAERAAEPTPKRGFIGKFCAGIKTVVTGMGITIKNFFNVKGVVTQQYPENRETLQMPERFRGQVIMPHDADGEHKCTGCTICEKACPNGSISVLNTKNIAGKKVLGRYIYRLDQCTICGLCVELCPYDAIHMGHDFEAATVNKDDLILILNKKEGRG